MALFEKKFCDFCGEKIGLLGNRKLEDGNMCKDCAAGISPWLTDRRKTTVAEMKEHLQYREQNKALVAQFNPNVTVGNDTKVYVSQSQGKFIVTRNANWRNANPDVMDISSVTAVNCTIDEDKDEVKFKNADGTMVSYNPKRYEYEYTFKLEILVNNRWYNEIEFELTDSMHRPDNTVSQLYQQYQAMAQQIGSALGQNVNFKTTGTGLNASFSGGMGMGMGMAQPVGYQQPMGQPMGYQQPMGQPMGYQQPMGQPMGYQQPMGQQPVGYQQPMGQQPMGYQQPMGQPMQQNMGYQQPMGQPVGGAWFCPSCGAQNTTAFCVNCGAGKPQV